MLDATGHLPTGLLRVTVDELHEHFVAPFPASKTRQRLYDQWVLHREAVSTVVTFERQWIDGSYVTSKTDPGDIDVITFVPGDELNGLSAAQQLIVSDLMGGHATRDRWGVDSFVVATYPEGDPRRTAARRVEGQWRQTWTNVKGSAQTKGFLEVMT